MKIKITISDLRLREDHSTKSASLGFATPGTYDVLDTYKGKDYTWYKIEPGWVAGIEEVQEIVVSPSQKDRAKDQVYVGNVSLRIRDKASTSGTTIGFCEKKSYYDVYETSQDLYYIWYKIGDDAWCAGVDEVVYYPADQEEETWTEPQPVDMDTSRDQVYIGNVVLNMRKQPSTSSTKMGTCKQDSNYYVYEIAKDKSYTWYKIGTNAWIAQVDSSVTYYPAGSSRIIPALKASLDKLTSLLPIAKKCIDRNISIDYYEELYDKINDLNKFVDENFDSFEYDLVDPNEYAGIDLLYTADVHGAWVDYSMDGNYLTPTFSYQDLGNYRKTLEKHNIKALLVDAGDWSRPSKAYNDYLNSGILYPAVEMKKQDYFLATYGNHEWRWSVYGEADTENDILDKLVGTMTACNLYRNGSLVYRPYRTAKIGSKKIAVIGIGYPSANGTGDYEDGVWTYGDYQFYDNDKLYREVQKYINLFKENDFNYIVAVCHMCKSSYESDSRYKARTDTLIQNTNGLTAVIQGHYNFATNAEIIKDKGNNSVLLAHESGANLNSFGRLMLRKGMVTSYLLDERSDLNMV